MRQAVLWEGGWGCTGREREGVRERRTVSGVVLSVREEDGGCDCNKCKRGGRWVGLS